MEIFGLGTPEIILILVVILLLFGKDKLPELARSVGKSFRELKAGFEKSTDLYDVADKGKKENELDEKIKELERQRHLLKVENEHQGMKADDADIARTQKVG